MVDVQGDFRADVSDQVAKLIEQRKTPWQQRLQAGEASRRFEFPHNAVTGRAYRGGNGILLMLKAMQLKSEDPRWYTAKQVRDNGWSISRGRIGTVVEYWQTSETQDVLDEATGLTKPVKVALREPEAFYGRVYNAKELDDVPAYVPRQFPQDWDALAEVQKIVAGSGATVMNDQSGVSYYSLKDDAIHMPRMEFFASPLHYHQRVVHELGYWTSHESRLNWYLSKDRDSVSYSKQALRVQLASLFVAVELGLPFEPVFDQRQQQDWVAALGKDRHEFFRAVREAEQIAVKVLSLGVSRELEQDKGQAAPAPVPVVPVVLTSSQKFEHERANPPEKYGNLGAAYAFGSFAGAVGEDKFNVYLRWSSMRNLIESASASELVKEMQFTISQGVPRHVHDLLNVADNPGAETTLHLAHTWGEAVQVRMKDASEYLDAHELRIADAERVGVQESVVSLARQEVRALRGMLRDLEDAPQKLVKEVEHRIQRDHERLYAQADHQAIAKKPSITSIKMWSKSEFEGREVYVTPHLVDLSGTAPHLASWDKRAQEMLGGRTMAADSVARVVAGCANMPGKTKLALIATMQHDHSKPACAVFQRESNERAVYVDHTYAQYFLSKFPGAEFHSAAVQQRFGGGAISVIHQGKMVGVLMPMRFDWTESAAEIQGFLLRNAAEAGLGAAPDVLAQYSHSPLDTGLLATKPTPASIKGWMTGELDGRAVYMTGELLDLSGEAPAIKCWEQRINETRPEVHSSTIQRAIAGSDKPGLQVIEPMAMVLDQKKQLVAFSRNPDEPCVYVDSAFVRYFVHKYDNPVFEVGGMQAGTSKRLDQYPSIKVRYEGELVGVVSPISIKDRAQTPAQVRQVWEGSAPPAPVAAAKPDGKAMDHVNGFTKGMPPVAANKLKKALGKEVLLHGRVDTVRGHLERWHDQGYLSFTSVQQNKVKPMSHTAYNAASYAEQMAHEKRMKAGGKVTVYLVNNCDLGKIAHDYAVHLSKLSTLEKRAATDRSPGVADVLGLAEIAIETGDADVLRDFKSHFGVKPDEFMKMNTIEQRQQLSNHFAQHAVHAGKHKVVEPVAQASEESAAPQPLKQTEDMAPGM